MKKIIVIPDSFKGSMSSTLVTDILSSSIDKYMSTNVVKVPIADGGEGSVDCFLQIRKGKKIGKNRFFLVFSLAFSRLQE